MIDGAQIRTHSGDYVWPLYPWKWTPRIDDITFALSNLTRFTGHTDFYSVAEHSCRVSDLLPAELQLAGLLHDAAEAYLGDCASPLKHHPMFGEAYRAAERALMERIEEVFRIDTDHDLIHWADLRLLATEKRDLLGGDESWRLLEGVRPLADVIVPWSPEAARTAFLSRYRLLALEMAA